MKCRQCKADLDPPKRLYCSIICREAWYAVTKKVSTVPHGRRCQRCDKALDGRKIVWCSMSCKREADTEAKMIDDLETFVRKCRTCGLQKPLAVDFYMTPTGTYRRQCKTCVMAGNDERNAKPDAAHKKREQHLRGLYNISAGEYEQLLVAQLGGCAVCKKPPIRKRLAVDHDHVTGIVRGLLCNYCNLRIIGKLRNADLYRRAAEYLDDPPAVRVLGTREVPKRPPKARKKRTRRPPTRKKAA